MLNEYFELHDNLLIVKASKNLDDYKSLPKNINDFKFSIMKENNYNDYVMFELFLKKYNFDQVSLEKFYSSLIEFKTFLIDGKTNEAKVINLRKLISKDDQGVI